MSEPTGLRGRLRENVPLVAVSFRDTDLPHRLGEAVGAGMDVAELRIDLFERPEPGRVAECARAVSGVPSIATVRIPSDGGSWRGTDDARRRLFEAALPHVDALDLEAASPLHRALAGDARAGGTLVIASFHDFAATPPTARLEDLVGAATQIGADLVKIATMVGSPEDLRRLARFTLEQSSAAPQGVIVIGMGAQGMASRVFFPALGSRLTYTFLGEAFAPGQLDLADTCAQLRLFYPAIAARKPLPAQGSR